MKHGLVFLTVSSLLALVSCGTLNQQSSAQRFQDGIYYKPRPVPQDTSSRKIVDPEISFYPSVAVVTPFAFGFGLWGFHHYWDPWCWDPWYRPWGPWGPWDPWYRPWDPWYRPWPVGPIYRYNYGPRGSMSGAGGFRGGSGAGIYRPGRGGSSSGYSGGSGSGGMRRGTGASSSGTSSVPRQYRSGSQSQSSGNSGSMRRGGYSSGYSGGRSSGFGGGGYSGGGHGGYGGGGHSGGAGGMRRR